MGGNVSEIGGHTFSQNFKGNPNYPVKDRNKNKIKGIKSRTMKTYNFTRQCDPHLDNWTALYKNPITSNEIRIEYMRRQKGPYVNRHKSNGTRAITDRGMIKMVKFKNIKSGKGLN